MFLHMEDDDFYRFDPRIIPCSDDDIVRSVENFGDYYSTASSSCQFYYDHLVLQFEDPLDHQLSSSPPDDLCDLIKTQIANHPLYPLLISAYIDCQKVGAPPEMASLLEEIGRRDNQNESLTQQLGADPELDEFMESYCEILQRFKEELSKPFDEATMFLSSIESELSNLCKGMAKSSSDNNSADNEAAGTSEEELSCGGDQAEAASETQESCGGGSQHQRPCNNGGGADLKAMLLQKYSGYLSKLRKEFLKKRKKGKLPKDAKATLLDWWNRHYRWPYPTEEEKVKLAEMTRLDQKQINNWFINQRKRHWKPSEDMRFALMEGGSGGGGYDNHMAAALPPSAYFDGGGGCA